jgi:hypothetical protein
LTYAYSNVYSIEKLNDEEISALCEYRRTKTPNVEEASRNADVEVAESLRSHLRALGFEDADISSGNTRLARIIGRPYGSKKGTQPNASIHQLNSKEQLYSEQTVLRSSDHRSIITTSAENPTIFHLENSSISTMTAKKRKRKTMNGRGQPITSNVEFSTSWPRHDGVPAPAGDQHFSNVPSHPEQQLDITPCSEEGRNMQHGDIMDLDARVLCQDIVVDAYETSREADIRERQRTENCGELVPIPCSRPVANARIAEHSQTPAIIADSIDANHHSPATQPCGQNGLEHEHSSTIPSPKSQGVWNSSAIVSLGGREEDFTLAESTRQLPPPCKYVCTSSSFNTLTKY